MESNEIVMAKINAAIKILEWAKDDIEPGIGGNAPQMHVALAEAFKTIYRTVGEALAEPAKAEAPGAPEAALIG